MSLPAVRSILLVLCLALLGIGLRPSGAHGQNNRFTERAFVASPVVRGMGDAGVALPGVEQSFFYNPAHLPRVSSHFTILGVQGAASRTLDDQIRFFNQNVQPAVASNFDLSTAALADLYQEASALNRRPGRGHGAILLPSFVYAPGALALGGGLFAKTALNYRIEGGGAGVPSIWLLNRTDLMALGAVGLDLRVIGLDGLSVGATGTQTRRYLTFKNKPLGRFTDDEAAVLLDGSTFQLDAGLSYAPGWLSGRYGTVRFGGAVYDLLNHGYGYATGGPTGQMPFLGNIVTRTSDGPPQEEIAQARQTFALKRSYRAGVAYQVPSVLFLNDVALALDYQGYRTDEQTPLARLHLGTRFELFGFLRLRGGLSAGYPAGGLGLELGALHLDYAVHGAEEGRRPGQLGIYVHTARLLLRLE
jgi:hypothetical protein